MTRRVFALVWGYEIEGVFPSLERAEAFQKVVGHGSIVTAPFNPEVGSGEVVKPPDVEMQTWLHLPEVKVNAGCATPASALFEHFKAVVGPEVGSLKKFAMRLQAQGFRPIHKSTGTHYDIAISVANAT